MSNGCASIFALGSSLSRNLMARWADPCRWHFLISRFFVQKPQSLIDGLPVLASLTRCQGSDVFPYFLTVFLRICRTPGLLGRIFLLRGRCFRSIGQIFPFGTAIAESSSLMMENVFSGQLLGLLLIGLLAAGYIVQRLLPRLRQRVQAAGRLQMLGLLSITPQCSVALVQVGYETLVLGLTPQSVTLLTKAGQLLSPQAQSTEHEAPRSSNGEEVISPFTPGARAAL